MIGVATKFILIAIMAVAAWHVVPHVEQFANDPRLIWVAMLPAAYFIGMIVLMHE